MAGAGSTGRRSSGPAPIWFVVWVVVGALWSLVVVGAMTIGVFVAPVALAATVVLGRRRDAHVGRPGIITGMSLPLLYVAYLNRAGPGMVCHDIRGGVSCTDEWSPWPWAVVGMVVLVAGVVAFVRRRDPEPAGR